MKVLGLGGGVEAIEAGEDGLICLVTDSFYGGRELCERWSI